MRSGIDRSAVGRTDWRPIGYPDQSRKAEPDGPDSFADDGSEPAVLARFAGTGGRLRAAAHVGR
jgi:hypothetical protein